MEKAVQILIDRGSQSLTMPRKKIEFTGNPDADDLLNNLVEYPHAFVLACIMDRQIKSERAWLILYEFTVSLGGFELQKLLGLTQGWVREFFRKNQLHRFPDVMADNFYSAIQHIHYKYNNNVENIWAGSPRSATIVRRFLQFSGVGIKIASMATNTLVRDFKIPVADKLCIDISPDIQVKRVFVRLGLIEKDASNDELIYCARELNPEYPGIFDLSAWEIGRKWCRPNNPSCGECFLNSYCSKRLG